MAEVLITLGILGVVIAMTLPSIIGKYQKIVATTQLKKIYNVFSNAYLMSVEENGESKGWVYPMTQDDFKIGMENFYNMYFAPYLNFHKTTISKSYKIKNFNGDDAQFYRYAQMRLENPDGMCMFMWSNSQYFVFTVDLNCEKSPNTVGRDVFDIFELYWQGNKTMVVPWLSSIQTGKLTRANRLEACKKGTYISGVPLSCFTIFVYDGMEFKKDYPWK